MIAQHSSATNEHYSPEHVVEAARYALGGHIDLDPASCEEANKVVKAERFIGLPDDGLALPWNAETIFLNPPGGTLFPTDDEWDTTINKVQVMLGKGPIPTPLDKGQRALFRKHPLVIFEMAPLVEKYKAERAQWQTVSRATAWWKKLVGEHEGGPQLEPPRSAVFLSFTLELLRAAQGDARYKHPFKYLLCVPSERLHFGGDQPTHANFIAYMGEAPSLFREAFNDIGVFSK